MGENRSIDDFLTPAGDGSTDEGSGEDPSDAESTDDASAVEPPTDEPSQKRNDADGSVDEGDGGAIETTDTGEDATVDADTTGDADTPRATYRWSPDGDDCPACGATVERRWRDGDRFVCADCKEW